MPASATTERSFVGSDREAERHNSTECIIPGYMQRNLGDVAAAFGVDHRDEIVMGARDIDAVAHGQDACRAAASADDTSERESRANEFHDSRPRREANIDNGY